MKKLLLYIPLFLSLFLTQSHVKSNAQAVYSSSVVATQSSGANLHVNIDSAPTTAVTGTFWQSTQPISAASLPIPVGAATAANQTTMAANQTNGTQQGQITDGTTVANVAPGTGNQNGQNALEIASTDQLDNYTITSATPTTPVNIGSYSWVNVQLLTVAVGETVAVQGSNDDSTWKALVLSSPSSAGASVTASTTSPGSLSGSLGGFKWFRLNISSYTSGSGTIAVEFKTLPQASITQVFSSQLGVWSLSPSTSTSSNPFWLQNLNATVQAVKTSAAGLYSLSVSNSQAATACWVQIFNVASGSVTLGTTSPSREVYVPASTTLSFNLGPFGEQYTTALSFASTTTEKGSTGSANGVVVSGSYF